MLIIGAAACAGDTTGPAPEDHQGHDADNKGSDDKSDQSSSSGGDGAECGPGSINMADACEVCILEECTTEAYDCCMQDGCLDIIDCARETQCGGIDCYAPEKCQEEIDAAGGPTVGTTYAMPLGDCAASKCAADCL